MATGHKHAFGVNVYIFTADCTRRRLQLLPVLLTVLFLYFYKWQSLNRFLLRLFYLLSSLGFLLGNASHYFEKVIRLKRLVEVVHEIIWTELPILRTHPKKFMTCEDFHERAKQVVDQTFNMLT